MREYGAMLQHKLLELLLYDAITRFIMTQEITGSNFIANVFYSKA